MPKTAQVTAGRLDIIHRQQAKPSSGVTGKSATLNVRFIVGRVRRRMTTATLTRAKANSVPMLVALASSPSGTVAARMPQKAPTSRVLARGVPVRSSTFANTCGTRPSRDMANRMRVWP
ncbi:hypothetical protein STAL104432_32310 [Streptomyces albus]